MRRGDFPWDIPARLPGRTGSLADRIPGWDDPGRDDPGRDDPGWDDPGRDDPGWDDVPDPEDGRDAAHETAGDADRADSARPRAGGEAVPGMPGHRAAPWTLDPGRPARALGPLATREHYRPWFATGDAPRPWFITDANPDAPPG